MKQKLFTFLLAFVVSIGTMFAWDYENVEIGDLYYNLDATNKTAEVTSQISYFPFWSTTITTATIPSSVTYNAVEYSVTSIGNTAFYECRGLTSVTIPNSVTSIGSWAFFGCLGLTSITIPNSVTSIGDWAFSSCTGLTSATIPNSVTSIGDDAFDGCSRLTSVTIPNSVTSIGENAFSGCSRLTTVTINSSDIVSKNYYSIIPAFKNLKDIFGNQVKEYIIGENVTSIGSGAFYDCTGLTSVTIPNSVTSIGENAFSGCSRLTTVTINSSDIVSKNYYSFIIHDFKNLKDIFGNQVKEYIIGENVTSIGSGAFDGCTGLTSVTIPNSVTSIGDWAFSNCTGLTSVTIPNSVTSIGEHAFYDVPNINVSNGVSVAGSPWGAKYVNGKVVWDIVYNVFMTSVVACSTAAQGARNIAGTVITIESYAFSNCTGLTSVSIPGTITRIGSGAFSNCSGLTSVTIPNSVTSIGNQAFYNCTGLTSITIPDRVTSIGGNAFTNCTGLTSATIGNSVTSIGIGTFLFCSNLNSVTIGKRVTNIGNSAFNGCGSLNSVTNYAETPQIINSDVFEGVDKSSCTLYVLNKSLDLYKAADEWKDFGNIISLSDVFPNRSVTFLDYDGSILSEQELEAFDDAIPPTDPSREGYTFVGWDKDYHLVTEDMVITAQYEIHHFDVIFKDWDGTILKQQTVDWNTAATTPDNPSREDYTFIGWDRDCSHVTEDMVINALYGHDNIHTLLFQNGTDNSEIAHELIIVRVPEAPSIAGFTFLHWEVVGGKLEDVITIQAVYQADVPSSAPAVYTNPANPAQKLIRNGNVYILTDDNTYTITGQKVK